MLLQTALLAHECKMGPEPFLLMVAGDFRKRFPTLTDEEMMCDPTRAHDFCDVIRARANAPKLPDFLILRTLTNARKRSKIKPRVASKGKPGSAARAAHARTARARRAPLPEVANMPAPMA